MGQPVLDRPATTPEVKPPGPPNADGYPPTNARGQIRGPGPRYEPEVIDALKRRIAKDMAKAAAAEAAEATDAEVSTGTAAGVDEIPFIGWGIAAAEGGVAIYEGAQLYNALKDLKKAQEELKQAEEAEEKDRTDPKKNVAIEGREPQKCIVGPYGEIEPQGKGEAHHIIPDRVYRLGGRSPVIRDPRD